jgi:hypothetical protein
VKRFGIIAESSHTGYAAQKRKILQKPEEYISCLNHRG